MESSSQLAPPSLPPTAAEEAQSRRREDLAYQAVTVAVIVLVLCSLWIF